MKKFYPLVLFVPLFLLTSCLGLKFAKVITKEEFLEKANNTKEDNFSYANIKCVADLETTSEKTPSLNRQEKIDCTFKYCYTAGSWYSDSTESHADYSETELKFVKQFIIYLKNNVRDIIKAKPINRESEAGLTFYDSDLAYRYLVAYDNYRTTIDAGSGETIDVVQNGDTSERVTFNSTNGRIIAYKEKDDIITTYTYNGKTVSTHDIVDVKLKITYSNKK